MNKPGLLLQSNLQLVQSLLSLQRPETTGVEEEEVYEDDPMDEGTVLCDEIDSSKMIDEEVEALIL